MAATPEVRHPLFARMYSRMSARAEQKGQADHRRELLVGLSGRVIEVGAGHGLNFKHYPETVTEVVAVEPEAYLRARRAAARDASVSVRVVDGVADRLPVADEEFDAGVASLMLCTVPDQAVSLGEFRRVIRPRRRAALLRARAGRATRTGTLPTGGTSRMEARGGRLSPRPRHGRAIKDAGFTIERVRRFDFVPSPVELPAKPRILGVARRT